MSTTPETTPTPEPEAPELSTAAAPVSNKRLAASGVIPKRMQSWIFLSVLLVGAVGLWFSSGATKTAKPNPGTASSADQVKPVVGGLSPDEVQNRLKENEDASRNAATNLRTNTPPSTDGRFQALFGDPTKASNDANNPLQNPSQNPSRDPIQDEERKREYQGRFASNIALSYRSDARARGPALPLEPSSTAQEALNPPGQAAELPGLSPDFQKQFDLLQAQQERLLTEQQQLATAATGPVASSPWPQAASTPLSSRKNPDLNSATGKNHVLFEGTVLEAVLVTRLNGDFAGPVICQVSTDVYSHDHTELLIPAGTRVLGETKKVSDVGQERLAVVFHRLIMPDGYAVDLDQTPGLNQIGETALHDKVNNHYFRILGTSIAVGAIAGLASIGANNSSVTGLPTSNGSAYREGVSSSLSQSSLHILDRFLNIAPTITIREGHRVRIFLTQDLLVPAYAQHQMPGTI